MEHVILALLVVEMFGLVVPCVVQVCYCGVSGVLCVFYCSYGFSMVHKRSATMCSYVVWAVEAENRLECVSRGPM